MHRNCIDLSENVIEGTEKVILKVWGPGNSISRYKMSVDQPMIKLMEHHCQKYEVPIEMMKFTTISDFDNICIYDCHTPRDLNIVRVAIIRTHKYSQT